MYHSFLYSCLKAYNTLHIFCPLGEHLDHLRAGFQLLCWALKYGCILGMDFQSSKAELAQYESQLQMAGKPGLTDQSLHLS